MSQASDPTRADMIRERMIANTSEIQAIPSLIDMGVDVVGPPERVLRRSLDDIDRRLVFAADQHDNVMGSMLGEIDRGISQAETAVQFVVGDINADLQQVQADAQEALFTVADDVTSELDLHLAELPNVIGPELFTAMESSVGLVAEELTNDPLLPPVEADPEPCPLLDLFDTLARFGIGPPGSGGQYWAYAVTESHERNSILNAAAGSGLSVVHVRCPIGAPEPLFVTSFVFGPGIAPLFGPESFGNIRFANYQRLVVSIATNSNATPPPPRTVFPPKLPPPIEPVDPLPPLEQCIPICGIDRLPPKDDDCDDPCDKKAKLYFNTETCKLGIFIDGCGPPRVGFGETDPWAEVPSDPETLCKFLAEQECLQRDDDDDPKKPPAPPRLAPPGPGFDVAKLCSFLPNGAAIASGGFSAWLQWLSDVGATQLAGIDNKSPGWPIVRDVLMWLQSLGGETLGKIGAWADNAVGQLVGSLCDDATAQGPLRTALLLFGLFDRWIGDGLDDFALPVQQQARFGCPTGIPTASEASQAWLANQIDDETWRCLVRANNQDDARYERITKAGKAKLGPLELARLRARGEISEQDYNRRIRELGFISKRDPRLNWTLSETLPFQSDIIRMMVRDAADEDIAKRFGTDSEFDAKFTGQLREWAEWQRIPEDVMRLIWRAHWSVASPSQLAEGLQRFRNKPHLWPNALPDDFDGRQAIELLVTEHGVDRAIADDIVTALIQQDILPKWIPLTVSAMFRPPTRVDTRRMLEYGVIDRPEAEQQLAEIGYSPTQATRIAELGEIGARARAVKHSAVKRFADGEIDEAQLRRILTGDAIAGRYHEDAIERGHLEASARSRKRCIEAVKRRFLLGEMDSLELRAELAGIGIGGIEVDRLSDRMECDRQARGRKHPAAILCQWFTDELIDSVELRQRLIRLGWLHDDANRYVRHCELRLQHKITVEQRRKLAAQKRAEKEAKREAEKLAKESEKEFATRLKETRQRQQANKRRAKALGKIAVRLAAKFDEPVTDAQEELNRIFAALMDVTYATQDEILIQLDVASRDDRVLDFPILEVETVRLVEQNIHPAAPPEIDVP